MSIPRISGSAALGIIGTTSGAALAICWLLLSFIHLQAYLATGETLMLLLLFAETMAAAFYFFRSVSAVASPHSLNWLLILMGFSSAVASH